MTIYEQRRRVILAANIFMLLLMGLSLLKVDVETIKPFLIVVLVPLMFLVATYNILAIRAFIAERRWNNMSTADYLTIASYVLLFVYYMYKF